MSPHDWRLHIVLGLVVVLLGAAAAIFGARRGFISEDGVSYLDVADAFLTDGWSGALNAYWSPLYPLLLAGALRLTRPVPAGELAIVHAVNFCVFVGALFAFVAFWRELERDRSSEWRHTTSGPLTLSHTQWWLVGYSLFAWCSLRLIKVWTVTPDMAVLVLVLVSAALLLKLRIRPESWLLATLLGVSLSLGYAAKGVLFPLSGAFLAAGLVGRHVRLVLPRLLVSLVVFGLLSAPAVVTLSMRDGRFTVGSVGLLNYARYVNGIPDIHWRGDVPGSGTAAHPTRKLATVPDVYEFAAPIGGTYPVWYDPTYWYAGLRARLDLRQQLATLVRTSMAFADLFLARQGAAVAILSVLLIASRRLPAVHVSRPARHWPLLIPAVSAFCLYALVYVEARYVAPFVMLLWGAALSAVRVPNVPLGQRVLNASAAILTVVLLGNLAMPDGKMLGWALASERTRLGMAESRGTGSTSGRAKVEAANALRQYGLRVGDGVAVIGYSFDAYWARLAGLRIVAEIPLSQADVFWNAPADRQASIISMLLSTGARAVVTSGDGRHPTGPEWRRLSTTGYYAVLAPRDEHVDE